MPDIEKPNIENDSAEPVLPAPASEPKPKRKKNFKPLLYVLLIFLLAGAVGYGVFAWQQSEINRLKDRVSTLEKEVNLPVEEDKKNNEEQKNTLSLLNDSITLDLPENWTYENNKDGGSCKMPLTCLDGAIINPDEKLPTRYGGGTEFFNVHVNVYENINNSSPQKWLEEVYGLGYSDPNSQGDIRSSESINGYDAYFWKKIFPGEVNHGNIEENHYVVAAGNNVVYIRARIYDLGTVNGQKVGDFRKFETPIDTMVKTIKIE